jgi:carbamoyl-phosphate synthase small subunit
MLPDDHRAARAGGPFVGGPSRLAGALLTPPLDAVVDPRIGAHGPALLALEDGTVLAGVAFGADTDGGGDLVANTSQTGYQEICTDPSYAGQVVLMTYPLIGNYGRLAAHDQSVRPWLAGLIVSHATAAVLEPAQQLVSLLRDNSIPAICGIDTRALARRLRASGSQRIYIGRAGELDPTVAVNRARRLPRWEDVDFVASVSASAV